MQAMKKLIELSKNDLSIEPNMVISIFLVDINQQSLKGSQVVMRILDIIISRLLDNFNIFHHLNGHLL